MTEPFIVAINNPGGCLRRSLDCLRSALSTGRGTLSLAIAGSEVSDLPGMSAAGVNASARRMTPALDAEALVLGSPRSASTLPVSPEGIVSPVVATRAMHALLGCRVSVFDCGTFHSPRIPVQRVGSIPARRPDTGSALPIEHVEHLFRAGRKQGQSLAQSCDYVIAAECVPGGTTTALGVLSALGLDAGSLVSSSMAAVDRSRRNRLIATGIQKSQLRAETVVRAPLTAVAAVGDPMQPFVCGLAIEASRRIPVVLAGGTQMLAVFSLLCALVENIADHRLCVITTKWVAFDASAGAAKLARLVGAPFAAACPDFTRSRHAGLQAYERGHVKEGVGLGATLALAHLAGFSQWHILESIDAYYDLMVCPAGRETVAPVDLGAVTFVPPVQRR